MMDVNLEELVEYFRTQGTVLLLESQSDEHPWSRYTYLAAFPEAEIQAVGRNVEITQNNTTRSVDANPWEVLQEFQQQTRSWLFGYFGYDLKNHVEQLTSYNPDAVEAADMYFMVPRFLLKFDRIDASWELLKGDLPANTALNKKSSVSSFQLKKLQPQISRQQYLSNIAEAQHRIKEGYIYEVNLSHQMRGIFKGSPFALYHQMKKAGPVPFAAYLEGNDFAVCCQSPERFLLKEGQKVVSQPIKGTARRSKNKKVDQRLKEELQSSIKEQAENLMIVDLVRNDLSRIARPGTVKVPDLFHIETFNTVHQMVSTVTAEADADNPVSILKACFPMGSMTGAPKIQAMKVIEELEDYRRGIYSGAIGYITPHNNFDFNVVIRTAIIKNEELFYAAGGAITSDSEPEAEWEETLIKARALTGIDE